MGSAPRLFILDFQDVPLLDSTGAASLKGMIENLRSATTHVALTAVRPHVMRNLQRYGVGSELGVSFAATIAEAVKQNPPEVAP
jgi:SulP family sulfate permease